MQFRRIDGKLESKCPCQGAVWQRDDWGCLEQALKKCSPFDVLCALGEIHFVRGKAIVLEPLDLGYVTIKHVDGKGLLIQQAFNGDAIYIDSVDIGRVAEYLKIVLGEDK